MLTNKTIVTNFIEEIWNQNQFEKIDNYVSSNFKDHSLLPGLPANKDGTKLWIAGTGKSFEHKTLIDDVICEGDKVVLRIKIRMKHIGVWRDIEPTHTEIETVGYRLFKLDNKKIVEHWALIDGTSIENKLRETVRGCKIQN
jgi:predicted SnoaL-like aldol condensation-catalyzing enzyme